MTDRPIIFSSAMVRALLEGRKTMTRRIWRPQPIDGAEVWFNPIFQKWCWACDDYGATLPLQVGDRYYVRENWQCGVTDDGPQIAFQATPDFFHIDAWDGPDNGIGPTFNYAKCPGTDFSHWLGDVLSEDGPWRPSIHMPRWASRITLIVDAVKVERLQDISEEDAWAEGIRWDYSRDPLASGPGACRYFTPALDTPTALKGFNTATGAFRALWDSLNAKRAPWESNPWVVAPSFEVEKINIDRMAA